ncbi:MAG: hypothetical protein CME68_08275 [Halobacteriovoraceae bacterium]|nr:hypothetical protein [Halobacteriovoraceae bacterium]
MLNSRNMISLMAIESEAYAQFDMLEKYVQEGKDLSDLPIQPLYMMMRSRPYEEIAVFLSKCSPTQRKIFLDLDLWQRDDLDLDNFNFWLMAYSNCPDEKIRLEFAKSSEFSIYLKSKFNIWTFDIEDPQYPDHDNYFLTEDNLLLFEFGEDFDNVNEIKRVILDLYSQEGVEKAYAILFKIVSENFLTMQEDEFRFKKERLRDIGFVDYYDALDLDSPFPNIDVLINFIKKKSKTEAEISNFGKNQILPKSSLISFKEKIGPLEDELQKVKTEKREEFLRFNFLRLVNGMMELDSSLKEGSLALLRTGSRTKNTLLLGLDYLKKLSLDGILSVSEENSLLEVFDFSDLYRIGNTLIKVEQKKLKKALRDSPFEGDRDEFLGSIISENLHLSFENPIKFKSPYLEMSTKPLELVDVKTYEDWREFITLISSLIPFGIKFFEIYQKLAKSGTICSGYYLNYSVEDLTFESLILSAFANFKLGFFEKEQENKMGITLEEYKAFVLDLLDENLKIKKSDDLKKSIDDFISAFGLNKIKNFHSLFVFYLKQELEDADLSGLADEEFKHVGGPMILNSLVE